MPQYTHGGDAKDNDTTHVNDALDRRVSTTDRLAEVTEWTWDVAGHELSMSEAEDQTTSYAYDDAARCTQTTWPDHTGGNPGDADYGITAAAYDAGRETSRTFDNSLTTTTGYVSGERLIASLSNTAVGNYSYTWDANDNKTAETITGVMSGYGIDTGTAGHDDEDRLVNWGERDDSNLD